MSYKNIIFDLDGVIFDSIPVTQEHLALIYPGFTTYHYQQVSLQDYSKGLEDLGIKRTEQSPEEKKAGYEAYAARKELAPIFPGMKELLLDLKSRGLKLFINTGARLRTSRPLLKYNNLESLFDAILNSDDSSSKVEKFKMIEAEHQTKKEETVFITDTVNDLLEAKEAGIPTIAITWGLHNYEHFEDGEHGNLLAIVDTVEELAQLLQP